MIPQSSSIHYSCKLNLKKKKKHRKKNIVLIMSKKLEIFHLELQVMLTGMYTTL